MILISTKRGFIEIGCPSADDAETILGNCAHGVALFDRCSQCEWLERTLNAPIEKCRDCGTVGDHYCPADVARE